MSVAAGFFGKIPARGDFVRHGLPADLVSDLDRWWQTVLPASRAQLGNAWTGLWMEAPIWRFLLPPGLCGAGAVAGLWLPSTDRVGRLFPLTFAITASDWQDLGSHERFLDAAEEIGLSAIERDLAPEQLAAAVSAIVADAAAAPVPVREPVWWTAGSRLVAPARRSYAAMPDGTAFTAMLCDPSGS